MQKNTRNKLLKIANIVLTAGVFYFAFIYGRSLLREADFSGLMDRWWLVGLAFLVFGLSYIVSSWHWLRVCRVVNQSVDNKQMLAFFASQPYKYLPSSIFTFSYRAKYAKDLGFGIKPSSLAQLIESFNLIGAGVAVSLLFYILHVSMIMGLIALALGLILAGVLVRYDIVVPIYKTKRKMMARMLVPNFLLMMGVWVVSGLAFLLVNYSLGLSVDPLFIISANAAAYVASILAVFAPGGIGIREAVLSMFSVQNSAVILWRLLTFAADVSLGAIAILNINRVKQKHEE